MAHELEIMADGKASMAYAGTTPWHNLGFAVGNDLTPEELCIAAHINWEVSKLPVQNTFNGTLQTVPGRYNLTRMTDGKVLDIVGSIYKPTQNLQAAKFFSEFVSAGGMTMETCGSLAGGSRIWVLAKINAGFTLAGGDRVEGYLLLSLPHKQGEAITVKLTKIRVVCANTESMALNGWGNAWRMTHARAFDGTMQDAAREALGLAKKKVEESAEVATLLSQTRVANYDRLIEYVATVSGSKLLDAVTDVTENAVDSDTDVATLLDASVRESENMEVIRGLKDTDLNRVGRTILNSILNSPGSDLESAKGTLWGAYNGVTHAVDHVLGNSEDTRLTSAWFGQRANMKTRALNLAVQYATNQVR
jgi:phage/plasmid-like protein (TIGR03299 family)